MLLPAAAGFVSSHTHLKTPNSNPWDDGSVAGPAATQEEFKLRVSFKGNSSSADRAGQMETGRLLV